MDLTDTMTPAPLSLLLSLVIALFCSFNAIAEDIYKEYQRESLSRFKGMENTEYFKSLEKYLVESSPYHAKAINTKRDEALRSLRLKPGERDEHLETLEILARQGDVDSMRELARYYELKRYTSAAYAWYRKAEESGDEFSKEYITEFEGRRVHRLGAWTTEYDYDWGKHRHIFNKELTPEEIQEAYAIYQEISK